MEDFERAEFTLIALLPGEVGYVHDFDSHCCPLSHRGELLRLGWYYGFGSRKGYAAKGSGAVVKTVPTSLSQPSRSGPTDTPR
jgi:hypothetical protein